MAIRSKPQQAAADERAVEAFIGKGGATPAPEAPKDEEVKLQLRPMRSKVGRIDSVLERKYPDEKTRPSRHAWIMEAINEKLAREEGQGLSSMDARR
jgi:hypothetical protein